MHVIGRRDHDGIELWLGLKHLAIVRVVPGAGPLARSGGQRDATRQPLRVHIAKRDHLLVQLEEITDHIHAAASGADQSEVEFLARRSRAAKRRRRAHQRRRREGGRGERGQFNKITSRDRLTPG